MPVPDNRRKRLIQAGGILLALTVGVLALAPGKKKPAPLPASSAFAPPASPPQSGPPGKYRLFDKSATPPAASIESPAAPAETGYAAVPPPVAGSGGIPDGSYDCKIWSGSSYIGLGTIRSSNNSLDTQILAKVGATFTGVESTADGITVSYTSARGNRESMDCTRL